MFNFFKKRKQESTPVDDVPTTQEIPEEEWTLGIFYSDSKKPMAKEGGFTVYYDFRDPRPESETLYRNMRNDFLPYSGFYKTLASKHQIKNTFNLIHSSDYKTHISCPNCSNSGYISHGWRVKCNRCDSWIESYGNSLYVWANVVRKTTGLMGTTFYHKNSKVSKDEFDKWQMFYKLLG